MWLYMNWRLANTSTWIWSRNAHLKSLCGSPPSYILYVVFLWLIDWKHFRRRQIGFNGTIFIGSTCNWLSFTTFPPFINFHIAVQVIELLLLSLWLGFCPHPHSLYHYPFPACAERFWLLHQTAWVEEPAKRNAPLHALKQQYWGVGVEGVIRTGINHSPCGPSFFSRPLQSGRARTLFILVYNQYFS